MTGRGSAARLTLLGVPVDRLSTDTLLALLAGWHHDGRQHRLYYATAHGLNLAYTEPRFRASLAGADVVICEGHGVRVGARVAGEPVPEVIQTMDWMDDHLAQLARDGRSLYLLGDEPGVADACADEMRRRHPGLRIVGTRHGYFDVAGSENDAVVEAIREAAPDALFVGMGNPRQEYWIDDNLEATGVSVVLSLGAMFRWYAGIEERAPAWMLRAGLWWLHRLLHHPVRHFRRYVIGNPRFLWRCLRQRLGHRP